MASDRIVQDVKDRLDIADVVGDYVQLKRAGHNLKGLCPFHAEKTPSFMVNSGKQMFHCFGCGAGGDVFGFVMKHDNITFPEALAVLAKRAGVELKPANPAERSARDEVRAAMSEAAAFYANALKPGSAAMDYVQKRGLTNDTIAGFQLGLSPDGWHNVHNHLRKKGISERAVVKSGLVAEGKKGHYDIFRNRLMFPIWDLHGDVIAFGGRVMDGSEPKYLNSPDTELFSKGETLYALHMARQAMRDDGYALVVEGYMDAIMCHQHGIRSAVAPLGTALTSGHVRRLVRYTGRAVLLFDGDAAGIAAARRSLMVTVEQNLRASVLVLPDGHDPDSLLRAEGGDALRAMIAKAMPMLEFLYRHSDVDAATEYAVELVARAGDPIYRDNLVNELAGRANISERAIREKLHSLKRTGSTESRRDSGRRRGQTSAGAEETQLLRIAIHRPALLGGLVGSLDADELGEGVAAGLLHKFLGNPGSGVEVLAESEEEKSLVRELTLEPGFDLEEAGSAASDCIRRISARCLARKIREAKASGDLKLLASLLSEQKKAAAKTHESVG